MLAKVITLLNLMISLSVWGVDFKVFHEGEHLYLNLVNSTSEIVDVDSNFIFDDCRNRSNICVELYAVGGAGLEIKQKPMNYDHEFSDRLELKPSTSYGYVLTYSDIKRRFDVENREYIVVVKYRDWKRQKFHQSELITVKF